MNTRYGIEKPTRAQSVDLAICGHCQAPAGQACTSPTGRPARTHTDRVSRAWSILINHAHLNR